MKSIYENDIKEAIEKYVDNSNFNLRSLITLCRNIVEEFSLKDHELISGTPWSILHAPIHHETINTNKEMVLSKILQIISVIKTETSIDFGKISDVIKMGISAGFDTNFWDIKEVSTIGEREILIKDCYLINPVKNLFYVSAFEGKHKKPKVYISRETLTQGKLYSATIKVNEFGIDLETANKKVFLIEGAASLSGDYRKEVMDSNWNFDFSITEKLIKDNEFEKLFDYILNFFMQKIRESGAEPKITKVSGKDSIFRACRYALDIVLLEDKVNIDSFNHLSFFPWSKDPAISLPKSNRVSIPKIWHIKYVEYLAKNGFSTKNSFIDKMIKDELDDNLGLITNLQIDYKKYVSQIDYDSSYRVKEVVSGIYTNAEYLIFTKRLISLLKANKTKYDDSFVFNDFEMLKSKKVCAIMGPAGHGKTERIKKFIVSNKTKKICIFAPTWKSIFVYDKLQVEGIVGENNFKTIQSTFGNNRWDYRKSSSADSLNYDLYVFDEISMYSVDEWIDILAFIEKKEARFILSGDHFQIPPVNSVDFSIHIKNMFEKNKSFISVADSDNFRLLFTKHGTKKTGEPLKKARATEKLLNDLRKSNFDINNGNYKNLVYVYDGHETLIKTIKKIIDEKKGAQLSFIVKNNVGMTGTWFLNRFFKNDNESDFQMGDIVVFTENLKSENQKKLVNMMTYEITNIIKIDDYWTRYHFASQNTNYSLVVFNGNEPFELSLFGTAHKAQGSSLENVVVIIEDSTNVDPKWLYTACSRVKNDLKILIPDKTIELKKIVQNIDYLGYIDELEKM